MTAMTRHLHPADDLAEPTMLQVANDGKLEIPYAKSLNINELKKQGVIK